MKQKLFAQQTLPLVQHSKHGAGFFRSVELGCAARAPLFLIACINHNQL